MQIRPPKEKTPAKGEIVNYLVRGPLEERKLALRAGMCVLEEMLRGPPGLLDIKEQLFIKHILVIHADWIDHLEGRLGVMESDEPQESGEDLSHAD